MGKWEKSNPREPTAEELPYTARGGARGRMRNAKSGGVRPWPRGDLNHEGCPVGIPLPMAQKELGTKPGHEALRSSRK